MNSLSQPKESPISHHTAQPDEQLACFDYLYYTSATVVRELSTSVEVPIADKIRSQMNIGTASVLCGEMLEDTYTGSVRETQSLC